MEPVVLVVTALDAGAALGGSDASSPEVADAYARLRAQVQQRLAARPGAGALLAGHDRDPSIWRVPLTEALASCGAGHDAELVAAARAVLGVAAVAGPLSGGLGAAAPAEKYRVDVHEASGVMVGSFNIQHNYFYGHQTWATQPARPPLKDSPYRGLDAFEADDEDYFFGREDAVREVLNRLPRFLDHPGLMVVSGVSGAGKSSLLRAGVLPKLRRDGLTDVAGSQSWLCLLFTPGPAPLDELAVQVASLAGVDAATVQQALAAFPAGFALNARQAALAQHNGLPGTSAGSLLLVVDQFEQLFTACPDEEQRRAFITALHAAATPQGPEQVPAALVILGVRADFEARCADYPELAAAIQDRYLLTAMRDRQLRLAITGPAAHEGSSVDPELTEQLLREISSRQASSSPTAGAGVLPLLSHALDQAWRHRTGDTLTLADYERTGGIESAVARSAQEAYDDLTPPQKVIARQVFTRLSAASSDGADTAIPASNADLAAGVADAQATEMDVVLEAFASRRLLTLAADTVEITHEVLLTAWPLCREEWLPETRADRIVRTSLGTAAAQWTRHSQDSAYLYTGSLLETASAVAARIRADDPLGAQEQAFLDVSVRTARRRALRRRIVRIIVPLLAAGLAVATALALLQLDAANSERSQTAGAALAAQSQITGDSNPALARLEAAAAWRLDPTSQSKYAMLSAALLPGSAVLGSSASTSVYSIAFSPDGTLLAAGYYSGTTQLWNVRTRRLIASLPDNAGGSAESVAFSPDGTLLAVGNYFGSTELWDVRTRHLVARLPGHTNGGSVYSVAFSPDGKILAVGTQVSTIQLWNVAARRLATTLQAGDGSNVESMAFSPDGKTLAVGTIQGTTQLWKMATRRLAVTLQPRRYDGPVNSVAFSPDGRTLAVGTDGDTTQLWKVTTRRLAATLASDGNTISSVAFSPDGKTLALATSAGTTQLVDVATRRMITNLPDNDSNPLDSVAFSPDGRTLAAGTSGGSVQLSDVATVSAFSDPLAVLPAAARNIVQVDPTAFSPDGKTLAVGTGIGTTQLWNVATRQLAVTLGHGRRNTFVSAVAFSPDGQTLAVADGGNGTVELWDMATRRVSATLRYQADSLAFSPDGQTLALAAGANGTVELWDMATRRLSATLRSGTHEQIISVAFSPDGKTLAMGTFYAGSQLWNMATRRLIAKLPVGSFSQVNTVAFSPDSKTLAVAIDTGFTQLWDVAHPHQMIGSIFTGGNDISAVFSPGGTVVAIGTGRHVQLWDAVTEQKIGDLPYTIDQAANPVIDAERVVFNSDGTLVAVSPANGEVQLWSTPYLKDTGAYLCAQVGQPFPPSEWTQLAPGVAYQETCP